MWNTGTKNSPASCCGASGGKEADFQHQMRHIVGQIKELSAGCGALQPDIATKELLMMQEKQYDKPQYLTLCTDLLS